MKRFPTRPPCLASRHLPLVIFVLWRYSLLKILLPTTIHVRFSSQQRRQSTSTPFPATTNINVYQFLTDDVVTRGPPFTPLPRRRRQRWCKSPPLLQTTTKAMKVVLSSLQPTKTIQILFSLSDDGNRYLNSVFRMMQTRINAPLPDDD